MGSVHPIKPRQRPVVFPLRRKRTVHWSADAASDNCPPALPGGWPGNPVRPVRAPGGRPSPPHRPKRSRFVTPASAAWPTLAPGAGGNGPKQASSPRHSGKLARRARDGPGEKKAITGPRGRPDRRHRAVKKGWTPDATPGRAGRPVPRPARPEGAGREGQGGRDGGKPAPEEAAFSARLRTRSRCWPEYGHAR